MKNYPVNDAELDALADKMLQKDVDNQWEPYTQYDLSNALLVLNHVAGSILFEQYHNGRLSMDGGMQLAEEYGKGLRVLTTETLGLDPAETMKDLKALNAERTVIQ